MSNNPSTPSTGTALGLDSAAQAISAMLNDDLEIGENDTTEAPKEEENEQTSREVQSKDDESPEETSEESEDGDEASESDEDSSDDKADEVPMVTVVIDGKSTEVPVSEAAANYQRQADYSRKTQALAEERKQFDTNRSAFETERQAVVQERSQYKALLGQLEQAINVLTPQEPNWDALAQDPAAYIQAQRQWNLLREQREAAQAERTRLDQIQNSQALTEQRAVDEQNARKLLEAIPEWRDPKTIKQAETDFRSYARTLGYSDDEITAARDPRALLAVYKAMKFDALQKGAKNLKPVKGKTLQAGSPQRVQGTQTRNRSDASKRLAKSGKVNDAAALFATLDL